MKDLLIELRPSCHDSIDISKIEVTRENNGIHIKLHGFTEPADLLTAYVTCECQHSKPEAT